MTIKTTTVFSPFGDLSLFEEDDHLIVLEWGQAPQGKETPLLKEAKSQLQAYFKGERQSFDLPLKPQGTPFQQKVWTEMRKIPFGETRTYGDLSTSLGSHPRAIGGACGRNPLPILIPCHRVVGANGHLTGYSGGEGVETKEKLLKMEAALKQADV